MSSWGRPAASGICGTFACEAGSKSRDQPCFQLVLEPVQRAGPPSLAEALRLFRLLFCPLVGRAVRAGAAHPRDRPGGAEKAASHGPAVPRPLCVLRRRLGVPRFALLSDGGRELPVVLPARVRLRWRALRARRPHGRSCRARLCGALAPRWQGPLGAGRRSRRAPVRGHVARPRQGARSRKGT